MTPQPVGWSWSCSTPGGSRKARISVSARTAVDAVKIDEIVGFAPARGGVGRGNGCRHDRLLVIHGAPLRVPSSDFVAPRECGRLVNSVSETSLACVKTPEFGRS